MKNTNTFYYPYHLLASRNAKANFKTAKTHIDAVNQYGYEDYEVINVYAEYPKGTMQLSKFEKAYSKGKTLYIYFDPNKGMPTEWKKTFVVATTGSINTCEGLKRQHQNFQLYVLADTSKTHVKDNAIKILTN